MSEIAALHPVVRAWLLEGPLSSHVPSYVARLRRGRYAARTAGFRASDSLLDFLKKL